MSATKTFDNIGSRGRITAAKDSMSGVRKRLRKLDAALVADLNTRLGELDAALWHLKEVAALLTTARAMQQGRD